MGELPSRWESRGYLSIGTNQEQKRFDPTAGSVACVVRLSSDYSELKNRFQAPDDQPAPAPNFAPNRNGAPTQSMPIVRLEQGCRFMELAKWGLFPFFTKDAKMAYSTFNGSPEGQFVG